MAASGIPPAAVLLKPLITAVSPSSSSLETLYLYNRGRGGIICTAKGFFPPPSTYRTKSFHGVDRRRDGGWEKEEALKTPSFFAFYHSLFCDGVIHKFSLLSPCKKKGKKEEKIVDGGGEGVAREK